MLSIYAMLSHKIGRLLITGAFTGFLLGVYSVVQDNQILWLALIVLCNGWAGLSSKIHLKNRILLALSIAAGLFILLTKQAVLPTVTWSAGMKTAIHAPAFDIQTNTTKLFIAVAFLPVLPLIKVRRNINIPVSSLIYITLVYLMILSGITVSAGLFFKYIVFDFTFPSFFPLWFSAMVLLVLSEELFYRGAVQNYLTGLLPEAPSVAILMTSVVFGLSHWHAGWVLIGLSIIAGIFYGSLYKTTGRLWCSIMLHLGLNTMHFILFSYPRFGA